MPYEGPLKPGDAVGVAFLTGDLQLGGTGTVTHIDGDHVYAFGHPMYNLGPTEFPMTRAYVYTVLPSLFSSMKLSTTGEVIGTFLQDRATTIAGRLGPGPKLIPLTLTLDSGRAPKRTFSQNPTAYTNETHAAPSAPEHSARSPRSRLGARQRAAAKAHHDAERRAQPQLRRRWVPPPTSSDRSRT